jgi:hypothetical protein
MFSAFEGLDRYNYIKIRKNIIFKKYKGKGSYSSRATSALSRRTWG